MRAKRARPALISQRLKNVSHKESGNIWMTSTTAATASGVISVEIVGDVMLAIWIMKTNQSTSNTTGFVAVWISSHVIQRHVKNRFLPSAPYSRSGSGRALSRPLSLACVPTPLGRARWCCGRVLRPFRDVRSVPPRALSLPPPPVRLARLRTPAALPSRGLPPCGFWLLFACSLLTRVFAPCSGAFRKFSKVAGLASLFVCVSCSRCGGWLPARGCPPLVW